MLKAGARAHESRTGNSRGAHVSRTACPSGPRVLDRPNLVVAPALRWEAWRWVAEPRNGFSTQVNGFYVAGSLLVPYSWGLHVASWIQKQNGK